ncbi:hypothetical protein [Crateriforma spongiae]|uniref:hypothetical protein n=1 Tax=Crateriforma spongiae TaxID=2724528 RepID=UPI0014467282|nr:hypothetical protein [Crateriforma spongiae]
MKFFKLPLVVTAIVLPLMLIVGVLVMMWLDGQGLSNRELSERASRLGSATAVIGCIIIAPFWFIAAAKFGKAKRESRL